MELKRAIVPFELVELKLDGSSKGNLVGYGGVFGNVDNGGDILDEKCFDGTLAEHAKAGTVPHMFFNHNSEEPIGEWENVSTDKRGLKAQGRIWVDQGIPKAEQAYSMLKSRSPKGLSIGYVTRDKKYEDVPTSGTGKKTARRLMAVDLREISPVPYPMNAKALVVSVKSALQDKSIITVREAEEILRDAGGFSDSEAKGFIAKLRDGLLTQRDADEKSTRMLKELSEALTNLNSTLKG